MSAQDIREGWVPAGDARLYFQERGSGPPLVLLHGWSLNLSYWDPVAQRLSQHFRIIAYDSRGSGRSDGAQRPYNLTRMVEDLSTLIRELGAERPILCGHSMGGAVVLQWAATYPRSASALVVADAPGPYNLMLSPLGNLLLRLIFGCGRLLGVKPLQKPLVPLCRCLFWSRGFRKAHPEAIEAWRDQFIGQPSDPLLRDATALTFREKVSPELGGIETPCLILRGSKDRFVTQWQNMPYHRRIPGSQFELISGSGHMTLSEQPQVFSDLVEAFLAQAGIPA